MIYKYWCVAFSYLASAQHPSRVAFRLFTYPLLHDRSSSQSSTLRTMSAPPSSRSVATDRSFVVDDGLCYDIIRSDQYPEISRQHEILEIAKGYPETIRQGQYPEVNGEHELVKIVEDDDSKVTPGKHESRTSKYRILGVRSWVLLVLMCIVVIAVALAVGLAIGIPASNRKHDNRYVRCTVILECAATQLNLLICSDFTTRPSSINALAASGTTSTRSSVEPGRSATISSTPIVSSTSSDFIPKATSLSSSTGTLSSSTIKCPANDTDIFTTFSNDLAIPDQVDSHNLKYKIHCKRDYPVRGDVRDMFAVSVGSLVECIKRCSMFNLQLPVPNQSFPWLCSGVALVEDTCTLKNSVTDNATSVPRQDMVGSAVLVWDDSTN